MNVRYQNLTLMKPNDESLNNQISQEFIDSGSLYYLEAKYLTLVTKTIQESNYSKALPDRIGCRGKAGKIASELVIRFLNKHGLTLTCDSFNSEHPQSFSSHDNGSSLIDVVKLEDKENPLHELVQIVKTAERHQYHHPKLVQALMNKVPHLLNDEAKSHFNKILNKATIAKNKKKSNNSDDIEKNISPINKPSQSESTTKDSLSPTKSAPNQISTTIQQPIIFLDEDDAEHGNPQNVLLTVNLNIQNQEDQQEIDKPAKNPQPSKITATALLLPDGDDYQKISSSNGTTQTQNEEDQQDFQNREIQELEVEEEEEEEYEYEYEVEEDQTGSQKEAPTKKALKKQNKKNKIQQQLEQQQQLIQQLQEMNQHQLETQAKLQKQIEQQQIQNELHQQKVQQQLQEQQLRQEIQLQEKLDERLQPGQEPKSVKSSQRKFIKDPLNKSNSSENVSQTGATSGSSLDFIEDIKNDGNDSSFIQNKVFNDDNKHEQFIEEEEEDNESGQNESSMTSIADLINDDENIKKRSMQPVSDTLNNLLKAKKQMLNDDESTIDIPVEPKKPQLCIETFSKLEFSFPERSGYLSYYSTEQYSASNKNDESNSGYSNYSSNYSYSKDNASNYSETNQSYKEYSEDNTSQPISVANKDYPQKVIKTIKEALSPNKEKFDSFSTTEQSPSPPSSPSPPPTQQKETEPELPYQERDATLQQQQQPQQQNEQDQQQQKQQPRRQRQKSQDYSDDYYTTETYDDDDYDYYYYSDESRSKEEKKPMKFKLKINKEQFEQLCPGQDFNDNPTIRVLQELIRNSNDPNKPVIRLRRQPSPKQQSSYGSYYTETEQENESGKSTGTQSTTQSTVAVVTKGPHKGLIKRRIKKSDRQADIQKKLKEKTEYAKKLKEELEKRQKELEEASKKQQLQQKLRQQPANKKGQKSKPSNQNYKNREVDLESDINTSSLFPPTISTVSEINPELMSPKQRQVKRREIQGKLDKLREELQQPSDPEEKKNRRAKIEAKIAQLQEEFERPTESSEKPKIKPKSRIRLKNDAKNQTPPKEKKQNKIYLNKMSSAQRRKRRNEIEQELQKRYEELKMIKMEEEQNRNKVQSRNIQVQQNQTQSISESYQNSHISYNNNNSDIETEYSQSPIQKNKQKIQPRQIPNPKKEEINQNFYDSESYVNDTNSIINESSSLSERRHYPKMRLDIPEKDGKEEAFRAYNAQENNRKAYSRQNEDDLDDDYYSEADEEHKQSNKKKVEYKPQKINIKKDKKEERNSSTISGKVVDEHVVVKDGKKKIKRKIHIPISHSNQENDNNNYSYNYNYSENQTAESKKEFAKSSSKTNNNDKLLDGGLGQKNINFILRIKAIEAVNVPSFDSFEPCDPYCLLFVEGKNQEPPVKTKSKEKTSNPVWNESFEFMVVNNEKSKKNHPQTRILNVQIKDEDNIAGDELLSSVKIDLLKYPYNKEIDDWFHMQNDVVERKTNEDTLKSNKLASNTYSRSNDSSITGGKIHLIFEKIVPEEQMYESENDKSEYSNSNKSGSRLFKSQNGQPLRLNILIEEARGLSKRSQYIVAKIKNSTEGIVKTRPINSPEPMWHESFKLKLPNPMSDVLIVILRTKDKKNGDDDIGNISIPVTSLNFSDFNQVVDKWYEFQSTSFTSSTTKSQQNDSLPPKIRLIIGIEVDKDDTLSSYSNSVTPNASSNNSAYRGSSSIPKLNGNQTLLGKTTPNSASRHLAVQIVEARGLPSRCSPFCIVQIRDEKPILHTRSVRPIPNPKWNQKLEFHSHKAIEDGILDISIKDKRSNTEQEIASLSLPVESLNKNCTNEDDDNDETVVIDQWFPLEPSGEIHLVLAPRMKDSPKPSIITPISNNEQNYNYGNDNVRSMDEEPGVLIDASSSSDINIDQWSDEDRNDRPKKKSRKTRKSSKSNQLLENADQKFPDQFQQINSEEE